MSIFMLLVLCVFLQWHCKALLYNRMDILLKRMIFPYQEVMIAKTF